jgi:hypothetical protein
MAAHEYLLLAEGAEELRERVELGCSNQPRRSLSIARGATLSAAAAVLGAPLRVSQLARWRMRAVNIGAAALLSLSVGAWVMSTDEVAAFAAVVGIHPVKAFKTIYPVVGVIVDAPAGQAGAVAARLKRDGLQGSVASAVVPTSAARALLRRNGDQLIPTLAHTGLFAWIGTPTALRREARELHLRHHYYYLEPQNPSLGELLLARTAGGLPVRGSVVVGAKTGMPKRALHAGDIIVVRYKSTAATLTAVDRVAHRLHSDELVGLPLSRLLG